MVNHPVSQITLDGELVSYTEGETLYEIATRLERSIPTLCYDPRLEAFGSCRLCMVEVEGARLWFVLDTGASHTSLTSAGLARLGRGRAHPRRRKRPSGRRRPSPAASSR